MSFGGSSGPTSTPSAPVWYPGQEEYIPKFVSPFQNIMKGDYSDPSTQALLNMTTSAAKAEGSAERTRVSGLKGVSSPALTKMWGDVGDKSIKAATGVPGDMWNAALKVLGQYSLQSPFVGQVTSGGGGSKVGLCWVWTHFNGEHGTDTEVMREYRNTHFGKGSAVDRGYKVMGKVVAPRLAQHPWLEKVVYHTIYRPLTALGRGSRNPLLRVYGWVWAGVWWGVGRLASHKMTPADCVEV